MPPKRSKSKERERKRKYREGLSNEKRNIEKEKLRERMRKLRQNNRVTLTSTLWAPGLTYGESDLYIRNKEMDKQRIKEKRKKFTDEQRALENQDAKKRMRERRENETYEERQVRKEKNRERMRKVRSMEKLMENITDEDEYLYKDKDENDLSDIVKRMNEEHRVNQGLNLRTDDEGQDGIENCICDIDIDCPYCHAQMEAEKCLYSINTEEEKARFEKEDIEAYKSQIRNNRKEKRKALSETDATITGQRALSI